MRSSLPAQSATSVLAHLRQITEKPTFPLSPRGPIRPLTNELSSPGISPPVSPRYRARYRADMPAWPRRATAGAAVTRSSLWGDSAGAAVPSRPRGASAGSVSTSAMTHADPFHDSSAKERFSRQVWTQEHKVSPEVSATCWGDVHSGMETTEILSPVTDSSDSSSSISSSPPLSCPQSPQLLRNEEPANIDLTRRLMRMEHVLVEKSSQLSNAELALAQRDAIIQDLKARICELEAMALHSQEGNQALRCEPERQHRKRLPPRLKSGQ